MSSATLDLPGMADELPRLLVGRTVTALRVEPDQHGASRMRLVWVFDSGLEFAVDVRPLKRAVLTGAGLPQFAAAGGADATQSGVF